MHHVPFARLASQFGTQFLKGPLQRQVRLLVGLVVLLGLVTEPVQVKVQLDVALDGLGEVPEVEVDLDIVGRRFTVGLRFTY